MAPSLVVCPGCTCHVRATEGVCPLCSAALPQGAGPSLPRTAAAIAMGLVAVATLGACGGESSAAYGIGPGAGGAGTTSSSTGEGGAGGGGTTAASTSGSTSGSSSSSASGSGGGGGGEISADYGVGPTGGGNGG